MLTLNQQDRTITLDESALADLARSVIESSGVYGSDPFSELAHDEHAYHDDRVNGCVHCATYRYHVRGQGYAVALAQLALTILSR